MDAHPLLLLADDDTEDREMFEETLRDLFPDATLITVADGAQAVSYFEKGSDGKIPDAIILDYSMPHKNGPEVLDWLREHEHFNPLKKFVWSTAAQQHFVDNCLAKGALEYFVKPNNETGLREMITKLMAAIRPGSKA